ncbi:MAG: DNA-binding response regulator [Campylobacterota bacterium]|nr:DNA-binding response regulator [Campylobacterota bacterium]MDQ1267599.1 DNA-binding response regulator [Campylobacterota bacterium]MDQ1337429.1 DNA-binding response regulator [Campylobacterota bacterium]
MKEHILIVEDDSDILELLEYNLSSAGYDVFGFLNTKYVRQVLSEECVDLIIMDRNLPEIDGGLYVEMLRNKNINIPVIFLSAKCSSEDIKDGFLKGADDYVTKPFNMDELLLRIKAVLRRYHSELIKNGSVMEYKDIKIDSNMRTVIIGEKNIEVTKLEIAILKVMISNQGRVLDRDFLLKHIWKDSENIRQKTVNVAMKRLKEKIDPLRQKEYIKTIRGVGYLMS